MPSRGRPGSRSSTTGVTVPPIHRSAANRSPPPGTGRRRRNARSAHQKLPANQARHGGDAHSQYSHAVSQCGPAASHPASSAATAYSQPCVQQAVIRRRHSTFARDGPPAPLVCA